mgnify:CR=1 FL=1
MTDKPMIENSDHGITLNKQLAWTIGGGLIGGPIGSDLSSRDPNWKLVATEAGQ